MLPPDSEENDRFAAHLLSHEPMLRAWLRTHFASSVDHDDIIQDAYARVLNAWKQQELRAPKAFLFATVRNLALNARRAANIRGELHERPVDCADLMDERADTREAVARNQELEILTLAIQSLPERCRQIFTLRKVYGLPQREIARKLGLSPRTVNAQLSVGVNRCTEFVENYCLRGHP